jgi:hypothetical protein
MNYKLKLIRILSLTCILGLITFQSCKKDGKPKTDDTTKTDDDNPDPLAGKDYLKFEGVRVEFRNPTMGSLKTSFADSSLEWRGNKPSGIIGDTVIYIKHAAVNSLGEELKRREGAHGFAPWPAPRTNEDVTIRIQWGTADGYPVVDLTSGTYELKKVDGKFVSILKNGTGTWTKSNGDKVNYTGIELKATWPN